MMSQEDPKLKELDPKLSVNQEEESKVDWLRVKGEYMFETGKDDMPDEDIFRNVFLMGWRLGYCKGVQNEKNSPFRVESDS